MEYLTNSNSFSPASSGGPLLRSSFSGGDYSATVNSPSCFDVRIDAATYEDKLTANVRSRLSLDESALSVSYESPVKGKRKLAYSMSKKPLYFFPPRSEYNACFNSYVRPFCLGWQTGVRKSVTAPQNVEEKTWKVVNIIAFYNDLCVLTGVFEDACTETSCPDMHCGGVHTFKWDAGEPIITPAKISALGYTHRVLDWCTSRFDSPSRTTEYQERICELFLHCFSHILHNHIDRFISLGYEHLLKNILKRFCYFVDFYNVLDEAKMAPLQKWYQHHKERDDRLDLFRYEADSILGHGDGFEL